MHFVIKAIERFWGSNDLAPFQRYELSNLVEGCREVLRDIESKLDRYQSLGSNWKNPMDRIRWAASNIAPIRTRLMHNAVYLSTFNATLARYLSEYTSFGRLLTHRVVPLTATVSSRRKRKSFTRKPRFYTN